MNNDLMFSTGNDDTGTPWPFFLQLDEEFHFICDVAASADNRKVETYFGPDHSDPLRRDCLSVEWPTTDSAGPGACWLNPPYSGSEQPCRVNCKKKRCIQRESHCQIYKPGCIDFVRKATIEAARGVTVVALLAARTDTQWWHTYVWDAAQQTPHKGVAVRFLPGRLKFEGHTDSAPFPSVVVVFQQGL